MINKLVDILTGCILFIGVTTSCREDRSGEYYALISTQSWMYETMQENYLFYQDLPMEKELDFFKKPEQFLSSAISKKDQKNGNQFSHVDSVFASPLTRAGRLFPSFGFEGAIVRMPDGSEAIRIIYTQDNSPAAEAQLKRGDWIIAANGKRINNNSYVDYIQAPKKACQFTLGAFNGNGFDTLQVVQMPEPRLVVPQNLLKTQLISSGSRTAYYILYNEFGEDSEKLKELFAQLGSFNFDDIILDLRYNPGGYVSTAQVLASNLAPASAIGQPFLQMKYNDKLNKTEVYNLESSLLGNPAQNYKNLYVITSKNTASASEIVINGLRPYMTGRMFQVGTNTYGKNLAQQLFTDERAPQIELWLTTSSLSNSDDFGDYFTDGLKTDFNLEENFGGTLGELGTAQDSLMIPILQHMASGTFPTNPSTDKETRASYGMKILKNSIDQKPKLCLTK